MKVKKFSLELINKSSETDRLYSKLEEYGKSLKLSKRTLNAVQLATEELFTNIVLYAFKDDLKHRICITIDNENQTLVIKIEDDGIPFNPAEVEQPDTKSPMGKNGEGGLGIHLAKQ